MVDKFFIDSFVISMILVPYYLDIRLIYKKYPIGHDLALVDQDNACPVILRPLLKSRAVIMPVSASAQKAASMPAPLSLKAS